MRQFFKMMFASMLGFFLVILVSGLIFAGIVASIVAMAGKETVTIENNSVLHLKFDQPITERPSNNPFEKIDFDNWKNSDGTSLEEILNYIKKAETDPNIKGIFMDLNMVPAGISTIQVIREALLEFKKSGKFIISFSEFYTQPVYYLASVSDKIYLNPQGYFIFKGISSDYIFFKGSLEKLNMEMQVIKHGKYKSYAEPFTSDKMSDENKEQTLAFINTVWNNILNDISKSRNIGKEELNNLAENLIIRSPEDAVKHKLVDKVAYRDEILEDIAKRTDAKEITKINFITLGKYSKSDNKVTTKTSKDKIAIIYAVGSIESGEGNDETIGGDRISKAIRKARLNKNIKAIVLRVNSGGGSVVASEIIWREVGLARKEKPVVVSMGDYAASGGYYISCNANKIFAEPNTLTGSIGVIGLIPNIKGFLNNKLGITVDGVKTNKYADLGNISRPLSETEKEIFRNEIERAYDNFITHVSDGRKMSKSRVDSLGQGRIWVAADAKKAGLIDEIGGLNDAIVEASKLAKIKDYKVVYLPEQKEFIKQVLEGLSGNEMKSQLIKKELGENYIYFENARNTMKMQGIQAIMPFEIVLN